MGQKVNPYGFRLGVTTDWKSRWFEERNYQDFVIEDWKIRDYLMSQLESAAVSRIEIERTVIGCASTSTRPGPASSSAGEARKRTVSRRSSRTSPACATASSSTSRRSSSPSSTPP